MKQLFTVLSFSFFMVCGAAAQQKLDPANYFTVDNFPNSPSSATDADSTTTLSPEYNEVRGWYTSASTSSYGGGHRQKSRLGGANVVGASATWTGTVPDGKGGTYLIYDYVLQSANNASNIYFTLQREFESTFADSIRHDMRSSTWNYTVGVGVGSWVPLMVNTLNPGKVFVSMGADTISGAAIMRADAIRFLRSQALGADIEVGKRARDAFDSVRVTELWLDSPLGSTTYRDIPIFNLGKTDLIVTEVKASFTPNRWAVKIPNNGTFPLTIPPGGKKFIQVGFRPFQEETIFDTLLIASNDSLENEVKIPLFANGINYNFILNAHVAVEPHYNAPFDVINEARRPEIIKTGSFLNSTAASFPYPIAGGNLGSIVHTGTASPVEQVEYRFHMPDSVNGDPGSTGYYYVEWGILGGSVNGCSNAKVRIVTPFSSDTIKTTLNMQTPSAVPPLASFRPIGNKSHLLNQGGATKVTISYTTPDDLSAAGGFLRLDLLRIRKVPTGPSIATIPTLNFGNVSIYPNQRLIDNNFHQQIEISSNGESALRIDSIVIFNPRYYAVAGVPTLPTLLPAINGTMKFTVNFTPDTISSTLNTTLRIYTNDSTQNPVVVALNGGGAGTVMTLEESNIQSAFLYPANPVTYPDLFNMNKWQTVANSGSGNSRLVGYIYHLDGDPAMSNKAGYVEYFPAIPTLPDHGPELDTFAVYAQISAFSANSSPRAKYTIFPAGGGAPVESVLNQNNRGSMLFLGNHVFLRSNNRDAHGGSAINGFIRLENDTALVNAYYKDSLVNVAKRDTFVLRADAIFLFEANLVTSVGYEVLPNIPSEYSLSQNYPNPFNPTTKIEFALPASENVRLTIYDILGREVRSLINDQYNPGAYSVQWDGKNNLGRQVATGMYIYHLRAGQFSQTKKMMLMK